MSPRPVRKPSVSSSLESPIAKKPAASVKDALRGDFVSIVNRAFLQDKLEEIANLASEATGADGVAVALREGDCFLCRASLGLAPEPGVAVEPGQGVCGQCLAESRLVLAQDLPGDVKSALAAPVVIENRVEGLIAVFSGRPSAFAASHSDLLCCLASDIAKGLESPDSIHIVSRDSRSAEPEDVEPSSREKHLSILQEVTAPPLPPIPVREEPDPATVSRPSAATPVEHEAPSLHFLGYADTSEPSAFEFDRIASWRRPFRNRWDLVVILAAVLIAVLTFGIWLRHHRSTPYQPYTGHSGQPFTPRTIAEQLAPPLSRSAV